jgi:hypothetical protein
MSEKNVTTNTVTDPNVGAEEFYKAADTAPKSEEVQSKEADVESTKASEEPAKVEVTKAEEEKTDVTDTEIEYKLSLGDGSYLDDSFVQEVTNFAKENKLTPEAAQKMLSTQEATLAKIILKAEEAEEAMIENWKQEVISDPKIGGANLVATAEAARRAIAKFGSEEVTKMLNETGYGNNPHVVKFLSNIGKAMDNDSLVIGNSTLQSAKKVEELFYGAKN